MAKPPMDQCNLKIGDIVRIRFIHGDFINGDINTLTLLRKAFKHQHVVQEVLKLGDDIVLRLDVDDDGVSVPDVRKALFLSEV